MPPLRVLVVCPWFFAGDAVGAAARDTIEALQGLPGLLVEGIGTRNDYPELDVEIAPSLADLLLSPRFRAADLLIYHFAIHHEYFDALWLGNGHGRQVVRFHNVTPRRLMALQHHPVIDRSIAQFAALGQADEIWGDSPFNCHTLQLAGLRPDMMRVLPLAVRRPPLTRFEDKPRDGTVNLLYVGRIMPSKGVLDLVDAIGRLAMDNLPLFHLRLVGNLSFSDPAYVAQVQERIARYGLGERVEFAGTADDATLALNYRRAHLLALASYHEGFCVPVAEALRAGTVPVTYDAGNLPAIANGLSRLVPTGDIAALTRILGEAIADAEAARRAPESAHIRVDRGRMSAAEFSAAAHAYVGTLTWDAFVERTRKRVWALLPEPA